MYHSSKGFVRKREVGTMIKKLALLMSIFFIFDRMMYYKIKQGYTHKKFVSVEAKPPLAIKNRKTRKRLAAKIGKRRSSSGGKVSNVVKA